MWLLFVENALRVPGLCMRPFPNVKLAFFRRMRYYASTYIVLLPSRLRTSPHCGRIRFVATVITWRKVEVANMMMTPMQHYITAQIRANGKFVPEVPEMTLQEYQDYMEFLDDGVIVPDGDGGMVFGEGYADIS